MTSPPGRADAHRAGAALFDWDGTLIDSSRVLLAAWREVTTEVTGRSFPTDPDEIRLVLSRRGQELFPTLSADPAVVAALQAGFQQAYERHAEAGVGPYPGAAEVLRDLRAAGVAVGVVTNKARARYAADAAHGGLEGLIDAVSCAEDVTLGKPDPQGARTVLAALGTAPPEAVFVGDSTIDVVTGAAAGLRTIAVAWGCDDPAALLAAGADALAETPAELTALVLRFVAGRGPGRRG